MDKFQDKTVYCNFAITEQTGGTGADLHTTAVRDAETATMILNGEKWLISHTDCSDYTYVIAVTNPDRRQGHPSFGASSFPTMLLASKSSPCLT